MFIGVVIVFETGLMLYIKWRDCYYLYCGVLAGLFLFFYGLKWLCFMMMGWILRIALRRWWITVKSIIYRVEYLESWTTYQKWSFIFARPTDWVLEGMGYIFKSERLNFKIPDYVLKPWTIMTIYVDKNNISNYWMDIEGLLQNIIKKNS